MQPQLKEHSTSLAEGVWAIWDPVWHDCSYQAATSTLVVAATQWHRWGQGLIWSLQALHVSVGLQAMLLNPLVTLPS